MNLKDIKVEGWNLLSAEDYRQLPTDSGVYGLLLDEEVVYIGKSTCIFMRVKSHISSKKGKFNQIVYKYVPVEKLDATEQKYIKLYRPRLNMNHVPLNSKLHVPLQSVLRKPFHIAYVEYAYADVYPYTDIDQIKEILEVEGIDCYTEAGRFCISSYDAKKLRGITHKYITEYLDDNPSIDNFMMYTPPTIKDSYTGNTISTEEYISMCLSTEEEASI